MTLHMTISSFQKQLTTQITDFLATKIISESSKQAYAYDLKQFAMSISGQIDQTSLPSQEDKLRILDLSSLYEGREGVGKLACLLILELGLLPSEILELDWADIDLDFGVVTVAKGSTKRVLRLEADVKQYLLAIKDVNSQGLLLGKVYTRQWLYKQIQTYVSDCGLSNVTAQVLRQQFILIQIEKGTGAFELARLLGLKSPVTLEKYYKT